MVGAFIIARLYPYWSVPPMAAEATINTRVRGLLCRPKIQTERLTDPPITVLFTNVAKTDLNQDCNIINNQIYVKCSEHKQSSTGQTRAIKRLNYLLRHSSVEVNVPDGCLNEQQRSAQLKNASHKASTRARAYRELVSRRFMASCNRLKQLPPPPSTPLQWFTLTLFFQLNGVNFFLGGRGGNVTSPTVLKK